MVRPSTPATGRGKIVGALLAVAAVFGYGSFAAWQQRTVGRTPGRNTFAKGMQPITFGDTPCEVGRLRVDWRAASTRRCEGDRWILLSWPDTERAVLGARRLPDGRSWIGDRGGLNPLSGERLEDFASVYGWRSGELWLRIGVRDSLETMEQIESRSERRRADSRWRVKNGFAVDSKGEVTVDLREAVIRVSGPGRAEAAIFMAEQY